MSLPAPEQLELLWVRPNKRHKTLIGIGTGKAAESVFRAGSRPAVAVLPQKFDENPKFGLIW